MMTKLRILLADDHAVVREGLKALVNSEADMEVVGEASTGRSAWHLRSQTDPDVVIMDISMPDMGGAEATELIRRDCPTARVLALTVHEVDGYLRRLLEAGATGYILKRAAAFELVRAIRQVAFGGVCIAPNSLPIPLAAWSDRPLAPNAPRPNSPSERSRSSSCSRGHINREIARTARPERQDDRDP